MEAKELRFGNAVTINNPLMPEAAHNMFVVTGFHERHDMHFPLSNSVISLNGGISQFNEFIEPIPITPEWLEKQGFKQVKLGFMAGKGYETKEGFELRELNGKYAVMVGCFEHQVTPDFEFIHQLQNAHYVTEGEELKIEI